MFQFTLVTPEKRLVTDVEVEEAIVPAFRGELNILPGHAPLITTLSTGVLRYREKGKSDFERAAISWGYCEVSPTGVNILAETAETPKELDLERIETSIKKAEHALSEYTIEPDQIRKLQRKLERARARKEALNPSR